MSVYLHGKFEVSSVILMSFRKGGGEFYPFPSTSKQTPVCKRKYLGQIKILEITKQVRNF